MKTDCVKGFNDYTSDEALKRAKIKRIIEDTFQVYGFEPAETPIIEYEEFVKADNEGDEAVSDVFKLQDKGKRKLALRYEFTFQLKRLAKNKKLPYKRYQIGPVFRDEPVSAKRFRQFTQCDVDIIGSTVKDEAEVLALTKKILDKLGIKSVIYFNNRRLLNEILEEQEVKEKDKDSVIREIDKLDKLPESEVLKNLGKYNASKILAIFKKSEKYFEKYSCYKEIKELNDICKNYGIKIEFQPALARGLSYYNGSVFEVKTEGLKDKTICAGGSYSVDNMQATGISFGLERLSSLAKIKINQTKALVISIKQDKEAVKLAEKLRDRDISCIVSFDKISKALEYANSKKIPFVIFVGEKEVKQKKFKLKDMNSGKESLVDEKSLIKMLG